MHESFLRFLRVGVRLQMLRPEMWLVPAVASPNEDDVLVKVLGEVFAIFPASRHCIQLKLSHVTFIVSLLIIWPINQHHVNKNQSMPLSLNLLKIVVVLNVSLQGKKRKKSCSLHVHSFLPDDITVIKDQGPFS